LEPSDYEIRKIFERLEDMTDDEFSNAIEAEHPFLEDRSLPF
jgi:hypothetical protein